MSMLQLLYPLCIQKHYFLIILKGLSGHILLLKYSLDCGKIIKDPLLLLFQCFPGSSTSSTFLVPLDKLCELAANQPMSRVKWKQEEETIRGSIRTGAEGINKASTLYFIILRWAELFLKTFLWPDNPFKYTEKVKSTSYL